jgi:hypothetical protein
VRIEGEITVVRGEAVRRAARGVMVGALALAVLVASISELYVLSQFPFFYTTIACLIVAASGGLGMLLAGLLGGRARRGTLEIQGDAIEVRRGRRVERYRLDALQQGGFREPDGLILQLSDGRELRVTAARSEAEALLDLAGLSAARRVLRVPLASVASQQRGGEVLGVLAMVLFVPTSFFSTTMFGAFIANRWKSRYFDEEGLRPETLHRIHVAGLASLVVSVLCAFALRALLAYLGRREAVVGTDGIAVEARGRRTFIPYAAMARATRSDHGIVLDLNDGSHIELPVQARILPPLPDGPEPVPGAPLARESLHRRELLLSRIRDAIAAGSAEAPAVQLDVLDRKNRPIDAWRAALRAQLERAGNYRDGHLIPEQLIEVVADVRAAPERRIAAAVALSATGDGEHQRRIRIAARACADEELRAAMDQAAEGEIDEAALDRIRLRHPG